MTKYIAVDGSAAGNKFGFGIVNEDFYGNAVKIQSPVKNYIVKSITYPTINYDETKPEKATNNRAELLAILYTIHYIRTLEKGVYVILTDSKYSIGCITEWYPNWIIKGITDKCNMDLIKLAYDDLHATNMQGYSISFMHQNSHLSKVAISKLNPFEQRLANLNNMVDLIAKGGHSQLEPTII
jgi:ribonuclease HI